MPKVTFDNGKVVEFDKMPSQADIDEVAATFQTTTPSKPITNVSPVDVASQALSGVNRAINTATGNIPEILMNRMGMSGYAKNENPLVRGAGEAVGFLAPTGAPMRAAKAMEVIANPLVRNIAQGAVGMATQLPTAANNFADYLKGIAGGGAAGVVGRGVEKLSAPLTRTASEQMKNIASQYRKVLNPSKAELNKLEIKMGKDADSYYELAAKEGIIIGRTPEGKMDTLDAIASLQDKKSALNQTLDKALLSKPEVQFDLKDIAETAKKNIKLKIKNATEYKNAAKNIDEYINDEIESIGSSVVDGATANKVKQGMWSVSYNNQLPNSQKAAREIGFAIKNKIDTAFEDESVKEINDRLSKYITLESLLENANNRVVGGKDISRSMSAIAGAITGTKIPLVGPYIGARTGAALSDAISNPVGITSKLSRQSASIQNPTSAIDNFTKFLKGSKALVVVGTAGVGSALSSNANAYEIKNKDAIGVKNNNPINLKKYEKWVGATGTDKYNHVVFKNMDYGVRAAFRNLQTHQSKHPNQTLVQYLNKFAEKNGTKEAQFVAKRLGISPDSKLKDIDMKKVLSPLAEFESGVKISDEDINRARKLKK